jgi:hypothetical protein
MSVFDVQGEVSELRARSEQLAGELAAQGVELSRVNEEQAQQTRLLKSLQRKLQLVTAERDSYKVRPEFRTTKTNAYPGLQNCLRHNISVVECGSGSAWTRKSAGSGSALGYGSVFDSGWAKVACKKGK